MDKKITVRFGEGCLDLVQFLEGRVEEAARRGVQTDVSNEIRVAVRQRMISLMPEKERAELFRRLGLGLQKAEEERGKSGEQRELPIG